MSTLPTKPNTRIEVLDIYRGFAVLGIFVVNIVIMHSTFINQDAYLAQFTAPADLITQKVLQLFFYTKFFPIFSLLFGLGIAMQVLKRKNEHKPIKGFLSRRMFFLFLFGVLHIVFIWSGDVLHLYALLGFFTFIFIKLSNKIIITLALILLCFPFYDFFLESFFNTIHFEPYVYLSDYNGAKINDIITTGTYLEGLHLRFLEYVTNLPMLLGFLAPVALSMFLLGLFLGKNKIVNKLELFIFKIKTPILVVALITNLYRVLFLEILTDLDCYKTELIRTLFIKLMVICDVAMGLFYLWLIGWIWYYTPWQKVLNPLKYVGRMALTNYILQSFLGLILFSSIGFKLYETLKPVETLIIALILFCVQVILSKIWLKHFKYGPLEWIWRCLTYKRLIPISN
ncbi:hypothetical protein DSM03_103220 [Leeuwenhoekiella aestuarii]|uniref:DUF418 domain-containing protein n=1 Tax=Leeuwenhoekiella aestuarii TaxID=2249426 RepID=A0A4Q0NYH6_9FLAO|nr:DUF418 domain-containing protein [Leeuwenhoekiella aestuarii]RXG16035.1 hypothetical protein DSM03_103220 [Leeuwenhoekiella aestuarii]RXG16729.1 hypothetical protein DSM04_102310 [Leeuwenhoekiella aestuarii]